MNQINAKNFALAGGILWGVVMFLFTLVAMSTGYGEEFLNSLSSLYVGYSVTGMGSIVGLIYGFLDAFIGLWIFAWLYNKLQRKGS